MMINKYARMMETMINDIFGFYMMNERCKSIFVFSDLIMAENEKWMKVVGKLAIRIDGIFNYYIFTIYGSRR